MGWLDSGSGDGYELLTPDQQAVIDGDEVVMATGRHRAPHADERRLATAAAWLLGACVAASWMAMIVDVFN